MHPRVKLLTFLGRRLWWHLLVCLPAQTTCTDSRKTSHNPVRISLKILDLAFLVLAPELPLGATVSWDEESSALPMTWRAQGPRHAC
jgi:hypothetical protein